MAELVPISEAKGRLSELVRDADDSDVLLMRHGRPAAVLMSTRRHEQMLEEIDDLRDRLSVHEADADDDVMIPWEKLKAEMGI